MDLDGVDVRQISVSKGPEKLATVVTRNAENKHRLSLINYEQANVLKTIEDITTAVFSGQNDSTIVAGKDSKEENIVVFDKGLNEVNSIKLTFPNLNDNIEVDQYRVFWVSEPHRNHFVVFVAYYASEDDLNENIGSTLMIWFGDQLAKPGLTLD